MSSLHVVFKVGDSEYLLPAADVVQMESYTGATKVPGTRDYVVGIVQIRFMTSIAFSTRSFL